MKDFAKYFMVCLTACIFGFLAGRCSGHDYFRDHTEMAVKADTITLRDTIREVFPVVVDVTISEDDIEVPVTDIVIRNGSLVVLPIEVKTYEGQDYRAQVSGYRPQLDWIEVFPETKYITNTISDIRDNMLYFSGEVVYSDRFTTAALLMYQRKWRYISIEAGAGYDIVNNNAVILARVKFPIFRW